MFWNKLHCEPYETWVGKKKKNLKKRLHVNYTHYFTVNNTKFIWSAFENYTYTWCVCGRAVRANGTEKNSGKPFNSYGMAKKKKVSGERESVAGANYGRLEPKKKKKSLKPETKVRSCLRRVSQLQLFYITLRQTFFNSLRFIFCPWSVSPTPCPSAPRKYFAEKTNSVRCSRGRYRHG